MYFSVQDKKGRKDENSPPLCMVMMIETALIITHVNYQLPIEQKKKTRKKLVSWKNITKFKTRIVAYHSIKDFLLRLVHGRDVPFSVLVGCRSSYRPVQSGEWLLKETYLGTTIPVFPRRKK